MKILPATPLKARFRQVFSLRRLLFALYLLLLAAPASRAQTARSSGIMSLPAFQLLKTDSSLYTNRDLPKGKALVLVLFSPDCEHCQAETRELVKHMSKLKHVHFVYSSFQSLSEIREFGKRYQLTKFPNVVLTRDPRYMLPLYYKARKMPFLAVYDARHQFRRSFDGGASVEQLLQYTK